MTIEVAEINENQSNIILSINRENGILAYTPYNRSTKTYGETVEFSNTSLNVERKVYSRTNLDVDHKAGTYKYTPDQNRTGNIYNGKFRYDGSNIAYTYGKGFAGIPKFVNVTAKFMSDGKEIKPAVTQKGIQSQSYIFLENYPIEGYSQTTVSGVKSGKVGKSDITVIYNYVEDYDAAKHDIVIDPASSGDTKIIGTGFPGDTIVFTDSSGEKIGEGVVDSNGDYDITLDRPLIGDEIITGQPITNGIKGNKENVVVYNREKHKVTIEQPVENDIIVKGKGIAGDLLILKDGNGINIGETTVNDDGSYTINVSRPLIGNEEIKVIPYTNDIEGMETKSTVLDKDAHKPTVNKPGSGETNVTGKGTPGDEIIITDGNGKEIGKGTVDSEGNFDVKTDRPLEPNEVITITPQTDGKAGTSTKETVFDKDAHKPTVDKPTTGDSNLTGKGTPGDEIIITDGKGKEIGKGTVDSEGNFDVKTDRPLEPNEVITITPQTDGKAGTPTEETVLDKDAHKPTVNKPGSGETNVTGKGTPGDEIIITDGNGKEIGKGTVDSEGNFDVKTDRPLEPNEVITITPQTDGKAGTPTEETVLDKDAHKPTVDKPTTGDSNLTGKGTPGDEIIITDGKGKEIGKGTVDSEGNFDVKTDRPLEPNEVITITPQTDGKAGTPTSLKVFDKYSHKPDLNPMKDGDELVSGTGVAGDVVIIIDSKGNEIGKGRVNILGKFSIKLNRKLSGGEEISAIPYTDGMRGTMITKSVMHQSDSKNVLPPAGISNNYSFLLLGVLQIVFGIKIYLKRMGEKEL
ncbi:Ig-like domain-containing protein [Erysipelothrix rhusiopathiae]|nr:Ig-like domain-containing protein [Erysipelothrix rhusiopathiae]